MPRSVGLSVSLSVCLCVCVCVCVSVSVCGLWLDQVTPGRRRKTRAANAAMILLRRFTDQTNHRALILFPS